MQSTTLITTAKNEGPYFWEWVAHHRAIGFEKIVVFQNDSDDLTHAILKCLERLGAIRYFYNAADQNKHQIQAYRRAAHTAYYKNAEWVMAIDLDEFLDIKVGDGTLSALIAALPDCREVYINWKIFGCGHHKEMSQDLVTQRYTRAEADDYVASTPRGMKTLFRPQYFRRAGVHRPVPRVERDLAQCINGSGLKSSEFLLDSWRCSDKNVRALAQLNHYMVKDPQSFIVKVARGRAHQVERKVDQRYWRVHNKNVDIDESFSKNHKRLTDEMDALNEASGGELKALTDRSFRRHVLRFEHLLLDEEFRALYEFCLEN